MNRRLSQPVVSLVTRATVCVWSFIGDINDKKEIELNFN